MRTWEHAKNNIDTHRVVVVLGELGNAASYEYLLVEDGLDWLDAQARWQTLDDLRIAGDLPGVAFVAVRSDVNEVDVNMIRPRFLPFYRDAPDEPNGEPGPVLRDEERIMAYQNEKVELRAQAERFEAEVKAAHAKAATKRERALLPKRLRKLRLAGIEFRGNAGSWPTLDGRYSIEVMEFLTECLCITWPCQHGLDRIRYYDQWIAWDNERDDYIGGYGPNPRDTRAEAAQIVADEYRRRS